MSALKWYNKLQFCAIMLVVMAVAIDWHTGLWASLLLVVVSIVKAVAERRLRNPSLAKGAVWALLAIVLYVAVVSLGIVYSNDKAGASAIIGRKVVLLIFPLCFLLTDTSYLDRRHFRALFFGLVATLAGLFIYNAFTNTFMVRHHAYSALYIVTAFAYVSLVLIERWDAMKVWQRVLLAMAGVLMIVYTIYVNSRAGIICLYGVMALLTFCLMRRVMWWKALLIGILLAGATYVAEKTLPGHTSRMDETFATHTVEPGGTETGVEAAANVDEDKEEVPSDARYYINTIALKTISESPLVGYGLGDYDTVLVEHYRTNGYEYGYNSRFNAHNQYTEAMLAGGVVGLAALLAMLFAPLALALRKRRSVWPVLIFTFIVAFNLLFESMLERQMGLLFIGFLVSIMALIISSEEKKFGGVQKD